MQGVRHSQHQGQSVAARKLRFLAKPARLGVLSSLGPPRVAANSSSRQNSWAEPGREATESAVARLKIALTPSGTSSLDSWLARSAKSSNARSGPISKN